MEKMIKVLIAEDEPPIARMLAGMIREQDCEMDILGIARNGREALKLLDDNMPDVIITDIKMPLMDGLALIEAVQKRNKAVKFVILSGYQEFDYARRAIQLNVTDYLLKPLSEKTLSNILIKLKASVLEERARSRDEILGQLYGNYRIQNKEISPGDCMIGILCFGSLPAAEDENMFPGSLFWPKKEMDKKVEKLLLSERSGGTFWQIPGLTSVENVLIYEDRKKSDPDKTFLMRQIYKIAVQESEIPVTMITRRTGIDISSIGAAHLQMRNELYNRIYFGHPAFIELEKEKEENTTSVKNALLKFCEACQSSRPDLVESTGRTFFRLCRESPIRQKQFSRYLERLITYGCEFCQIPMEEQEKIEIPATLSNLSSIDEVEREINCIFSEIQKNLEIKVRHPALVHVKKFIEDNSEAPLTNEQISNRFGFSTAYLGRIFKEAYGLSMGEYLVQLKISQAKQIMKQHPDMLLKEIASKVGYPDPYYFSKVFKKKTGIWPSQYIKKKV